MTATSYRHSFADDEDSRPTMRVPLASPCMFIGGCSAPSVGSTGRCAAHQASRPVAVETHQQRTARLVRELCAIADRAGRRMLERSATNPRQESTR